MGNRLRNKQKLENMKLYENLITPIYKDVYRLIFSIVRNKHAADDVMQSSLIIGYKNLHQLKDKDKFKSWMFTIAKREAIKFLNKNKRELLIEPEKCEALAEESYLDEMAIWQQEGIDIRDDIIEIINGLKPEYQDIIFLIYYSDLTLQEASEVLNINYNTVKTWHRRAKQSIYNELKKRGLVRDETINSI